MAVLQRWQDAGAHWAVIARHADVITVGLYRCDGGEEVDRGAGLPTATRASRRHRRHRAGVGATAAPAAGMGAVAAGGVER